MRSLLRSRRRLLVAVLASALGAACSSTSGTEGTAAPTLVTVSPAAFAGDVPCANLPGAWRSYVATLIDVTDPSRPFRLASSAPVSCQLPVSFAFVVPGHYYIAEIQGYDRADLAPFGGTSSGSPHMTDPSTGLDVSPRWTTTCGAVPDPNAVADAGPDNDASDAATESEVFAATSTVCWPSTNVLVQHCSPLTDLQPSDQTALTLDLSAIRGSLECGSAPGQIARLRVVPHDPALQPYSANCDELVPYSNLAPGVDYEFRVEAFENGSTTASWATSCRARTEQGLTKPAQCDPLSDKGALVVDIASILAQADHRCAPDDITSYRAVLVGAASNPSELACTADTVLNGLAPTVYQVAVDAFGQEHQTLLTAYCEAAVRPGQTTPAACTVGPSQ